MPDSVKSVGNYAFNNCAALTTLKLPKNNTAFGSDVFYDCQNLTNVEMPEGQTVIASGMFGNCKSLKTFSVPNTLTSIKDRAFNGCLSLESLTLSVGFKSLGKDVFDGCNALKYLIFMGNAPKVEGMYLGAGLGSNYRWPNPIYTGLREYENKYAYVTYYKDGAKGFTDPWCEYPCLPLSQKPSDIVSDIVKGDLMHKGKPTLGSFSLLGKYLLGKATLDDYQMKAADMNGDGKVTLKDFSMLGRKLLTSR